MGPQFKLHPVFPKKTNVEFVQEGREGGREGGVRSLSSSFVFIKIMLLVKPHFLAFLPPSFPPSLPRSWLPTSFV